MNNSKIISKIINVNNKYFIKITFNNDIHRLYQLKDIDNKVYTESFNRDAFLMKANKIVRLSNKIECQVASI